MRGFRRLLFETAAIKAVLAAIQRLRASWLYFRADAEEPPGHTASHGGMWQLLRSEEKTSSQLSRCHICAYNKLPVGASACILFAGPACPSLRSYWLTSQALGPGTSNAFSDLSGRLVTNLGLLNTTVRIVQRS